MTPSIEVILYDLGNVILPFNHYQIAEKLVRFSPKTEKLDPKRVFSFLFDFENGAINRYETGKVSSHLFFSSLKETFRLSLAFEEFIPIWNEIFCENQEVSEIILSQKGRWRLGLLSNTNPLHFHHVLETFPIVRVFDRWILSHEVGFKKPSLEIFQKAIEWAGVDPERILFIDDLERNVEAARSLGMQGIWFRSPSQLREVFFKIPFSPPSGPRVF
jgi:putative hydrolase of the HAD superfamily